jgi:nitric oxide reductase subunit B
MSLSTTVACSPSRVRNERSNALIEWLRLPGDVVFIAGGVLPILYLCWLGVRYTNPSTTREEHDTVLFAEVTDV